MQLWLLAFATVALAALSPTVACAQAPLGTTKRVHNFLADSIGEERAINISIATDGVTDDVWIAIEFERKEGLDPLVRRVKFVHWNGATYDKKDFNPLAPGLVEVHQAADGQMPGHYPSVAVRDSATFAFVTTNWHPTVGDLPVQFRALRQDKVDLTQAASIAPFFAAGASTDISQKRSAMAWSESGDEALYVCWTQADLDTWGFDDDDVMLKQTDQTASGWGTSLINASTRVVQASHPTVDDHCAVAFSDEELVPAIQVNPYAFTAFHSGDSVHFDAALRDSSTGWVPSNGNHGGELATPLLSDPDADYPSIDAANAVGPDLSQFWIVAQNKLKQTPLVRLSDDWLLTWRCFGRKTDCDEPSEWDFSKFDPTPTSDEGVVASPAVIAEPWTRNAYVVFETADESEIALAKWCDGDSNWSLVGYLDMDDSPNWSNADYGDVYFGQSAANSVSTIAYTAAGDGYIHAVFLSEDNSTLGNDTIDAFHWRVSVNDPRMCP